MGNAVEAEKSWGSEKTEFVFQSLFLRGKKKKKTETTDCCNCALPKRPVEEAQEPRSEGGAFRPRPVIGRCRCPVS